MQARPDNKYVLQDMYEEIDLLDRKIAHCQKYERFDSERERTSAVEKLAAKRALLVKTAAAMASRGIECDTKYLPRSFKEAAASAKAAL